jgi:hypothetical protein
MYGVVSAHVAESTSKLIVQYLRSVYTHDELRAAFVQALSAGPEARPLSVFAIVNLFDASGTFVTHSRIIPRQVTMQVLRNMLVNFRRDVTRAYRRYMSDYRSTHAVNHRFIVAKFRYIVARINEEIKSTIPES